MSTAVAPVTLPDTEVHMLQSSYIDQEYKLFISLPDKYADSEETYPVLYVTDANWFFSLFQSVFLLPIPPMIVVGIGYPTDDSAEIARLRARDFLPTKGFTDEAKTQETPRKPMEAGGGGNFLSFIREDLFPFINSKYRTNPEDRSLWCYSYGGTFGIYTLFNHLATFKRYIIGAPTLIWDNRVCFTYAREFAEKSTDLPTKLYLCVGTLDEDMVEHNVSLLFEFYAILKHRNYASLDMELGVFTGETHVSGIMPCISWGLRSIFG